MLHTLLLILKIIGITIGVVFGIAFILLLMILFIPVQYRVDGIKDSECGQEEIELHFTWLACVFHGYVKYKDKKTKNDIFLFHKKLGMKKEHKSKIAQIVNKKYTLSELYDMMKLLPKNVKEVYSFLTNPTHKKAFRHVWKELGFLWKKLKPKKMDANLLYGSEDPYEVGQFMAVMSIPYAWYGDWLRIQVDYERSVLKGQLHMHGRVAVLWLVIAIFKIYFDDSFAKMYEDFEKIADI